jgi:hypothetical protein
MLTALAIVLAVALFWTGAVWHRWYQDEQSVNAPLDFLLTALLTARLRVVDWWSPPRPPLPSPSPATGGESLRAAAAGAPVAGTASGPAKPAAGPVADKAIPF